MFKLVELYKVYSKTVEFEPPDIGTCVWRQSAAVLLLEDRLLPLLVGVRSRVTQHGGTRHNSDQLVPTLLIHPRGGKSRFCRRFTQSGPCLRGGKKRKEKKFGLGDKRAGGGGAGACRRRRRRDSSSAADLGGWDLVGAAEVSVKQQKWAAVKLLRLVIAIRSRFLCLTDGAFSGNVCSLCELKVDWTFFFVDRLL